MNINESVLPDLKINLLSPGGNVYDGPVYAGLEYQIKVEYLIKALNVSEVELWGKVNYSLNIQGVNQPYANESIFHIPPVEGKEDRYTIDTSRIFPYPGEALVTANMTFRINNIVRAELSEKWTIKVLPSK